MVVCAWLCAMKVWQKGTQSKKRLRSFRIVYCGVWVVSMRFELRRYEAQVVSMRCDGVWVQAMKCEQWVYLGEVWVWVMRRAEGMRREEREWGWRQEESQVWGESESEYERVRTESMRPCRVRRASARPWGVRMRCEVSVERVMRSRRGLGRSGRISCDGPRNCSSSPYFSPIFCSLARF